MTKFLLTLLTAVSLFAQAPRPRFAGMVEAVGQSQAQPHTLQWIHYVDYDAPAPPVKKVSDLQYISLSIGESATDYTTGSLPTTCRFYFYGIGGANTTISLPGYYGRLGRKATTQTDITNGGCVVNPYLSLIEYGYCETNLAYPYIRDSADPTPAKCNDYWYDEPIPYLNINAVRITLHFTKTHTNRGVATSAAGMFSAKGRF